MTKLDLVLERIRQLPLERQEAIAAELESLLEHPGESLLTDAQWAEVEAALAARDEPVSAHSDVIARARSMSAE